MTSIRICKIRSDATTPRRATSGAAGFDLYAATDAPICIEPGHFKMIPTGVAMALPEGFEAQVRPRSGLAAKHGVTVLNSPGTIDADYRGEIRVILINHGPKPFVIEHGDRIAQMVVQEVKALSLTEVESVDDLGETERGSGGFGSTGRRDAISV